MKRILAIILCLSLLMGSMTVVFAEGNSTSVPRANVTDNEAPTIEKFTFTENKKTLRPGDTLHVSAKLTDNTAVNYGYVNFSCKKGDQWLNSMSVYLSYDAEKDLFTGECTLNKSYDAGEHAITSIYAYDIYGNYLELYCDYSTKKMGKFKYKADTIKASVTIKENKKSVGPMDPIHITVKPKKKVEGAGYAEVLLMNNEAGHGRWFWLKLDEATGNFVTEDSGSTFGYKNSAGKVECNMPNGKYEVTKIEFHASEGSSVIGNVYISNGDYVTLKNAGKDNKGPTISSAKISVKGKTVGLGTTIHISAKVKDSNGVESVWAYLYSTDNKWEWDAKTKTGKGEGHGNKSVSLKNTSGSTWEADYTIPDNTVNGTYYLEIDANDKLYNSSWKNFEKQKFTFKGEDVASSGMTNFVKQAFSTLRGSAGTDDEVKALATKIAERKVRGVGVVYEIISKVSGLSDTEKATRLLKFMKGSAAASDVEKLAAELAGGKSLEAVIDGIADSAEFREKCQNYQVKVGSLTKKTVTSIKLNKDKVSLSVGKSVKLKATVEPADAADKTLVWSTSNSSVATVKKGKIKAVGKGECVITCKSKDGGAKVEIKVTVK